MMNGAAATSRWSITTSLVVALLAACGGVEGASLSEHSLVTALAGGDSIAALERPAAFAGALPCTGCDGIDATLLLLPDGSFRLQEKRRSGRERDTLVSIGRWIVRPDSVRSLVLLGEVGPRTFAIASDLRLAVPSTERRDGSARALFELVRVSAPRALSGVVLVRGEFRDRTDGANFVTCSGGRQFRIAGDSGLARLRRAHRDHSLGDGAATLVEVRGRLSMVASTEDSGPLERIEVDSFAFAAAGGCEVSRTLATLVVGDWTLTALDGLPLPELTAATRPSLRFVPTEEQLFGNAGCNRFTGRTVLRGLDLEAHPVAMTRRACADSAVMAREARYGEILSKGGWFRLDGPDLVLAQSGTEVARFRRR